MNPFKRILFATDFSDCSQPARRVAESLAVKLSAELHLLHVIADPAVYVLDPTALPAEAIHEMLAQREAESIAALNRLPEEGADEIQATVRATRQGAARDEIVHYAEENNIDLIVIGTHGRTGLGRLVLGSVAEGVVRLAKCPVLTVRANEA